MQIEFESKYIEKQTVELVWETYQNNQRDRLSIVDAETKESLVTASVNLPEIELLEGEMLIKDYSENEGVLLGLVNAGVVEHTGKEVPIGYVTIPIVKILKQK